MLKKLFLLLTIIALNNIYCPEVKSGPQKTIKKPRIEHSYTCKKCNFWTDDLSYFEKHTTKHSGKYKNN